jgi:hypothetical protein
MAAPGAIDDREPDVQPQGQRSMYLRGFADFTFPVL